MKLLRDLMRDYRFTTGFVVLVVLVLFALLSFFSPYDPTEWGVVPRDMRPSAEYWFGTTTFGEDVFSQFVYGLAPTFQVGIIGGGIATILGMLIGFVAGYRGGKVDAGNGCGADPLYRAGINGNIDEWRHSGHGQIPERSVFDLYGCQNVPRFPDGNRGVV